LADDVDFVLESDVELDSDFDSLLVSEEPEEVESDEADSLFSRARLRVP
jgi:hypothetical protein